MPHNTQRHRLRRWVVFAVMTLVAVELVYVIAANVLLRTDLLSGLINKKPEKMLIQWESASTWIPGVVHVEGFALRNQSKKVQVYLTLERATAVISLTKLPFKTFHLRSANAEAVDFRLRRRLDAPRTNDVDGGAEPKPIVGSEFFPDIPGYSNPPDPKPEDLYPRKKKRKSPWTMRFSGVDVTGPIRVAIDRFRLEGDGAVRGEMTYKLRDTIRISKARLDLTGTRVWVDNDLASDNLEMEVRSRWKPFPAKGSKLPDIVNGISGRFTIRGDLLPKISKRTSIVPGLTTYGAGHLDTTFELDAGVLRSKSSYAFSSDDFKLEIMGLNVKGSARLTGETARRSGADVTAIHLEFEDYALVNPQNAAVGVTGSGLTMDASWNDLTPLGDVSPSSVQVVLPRTTIQDVRVLGELIPPTDDFSLESGTGEVESLLMVDGDGIASGHVVLKADAITLDVRGAPMRADLAVDAHLVRGDLERRRFEVSDTSVNLEDVVDLVPNTKKPAEPWWSRVDLETGTVTFGAPLTATGSVRLRMQDTRAVVAMMSGLVRTPKWMSLMPNVKNVDGSATVDIGDDHKNFEDAEILGDGLEIRGWVHLRPKASNGRIYARYKGLDTGISLTDGKGKLHVAKPRKWFAAQPGPG